MLTFYFQISWFFRQFYNVLFLWDSHRAMFKLGAKNLFLLCLLIKKKSAVYSADRCNFSEPETDCSRNENNLYKSWVEGALNSGSFGLFRFANHLFNWQILIKVWTCVKRFILFLKNNPRVQKSPSNLNIAPWGPTESSHCVCLHFVCSKGSNSTGEVLRAIQGYETTIK